MQQSSQKSPLFIELIFISLFVFASVFTPQVSAQVDTSVCDAKGFGQTGCLKCTANPDSDPLNCSLEQQGVSPGVACKAGSDAPNANICGDITDYAQCITKYIPCVPRTVTNGSFYCRVDGVVRTCEACDNDKSTSVPDCPASVYGTESDCISACIIPDSFYDCVTSGGVCRTSPTCDQGEELLGDARCKVGICCRTIQSPTAAQLVQGGCLENATIKTAIGCVPYDLVSKLTSFFIAWGLGIAGGIAFLTLIAGAFQIMFSAGDPSKLNSGRDLVGSAIAGVLMLIFSIFLLRLVGVNVLGLF